MTCGRGQGGKIVFRVLPARQFAGGGSEMSVSADLG